MNTLGIHVIRELNPGTALLGALKVRIELEMLMPVRLKVGKFLMVEINKGIFKAGEWEWV